MNTIDWSKIIEILITSVASALFTGILIFAAQKYIERSISRNLEKFKADLQITAIEHQTRFSRLYEKRAEVVAEIYQRVIEAEINLMDARWHVEFGKEDPNWESLEKARQTINELFLYFERNRIYLSEDLCKSIEKFQMPLLDATTESIRTTEQLAQKLHSPDGEVFVGLYADPNELRPLRRKIENEFRNVLGSK